MGERGMGESGGERIELTGEQASQGYTVLRTPLRKAVFLGGLVLAVLVAAVLSLHR